MLRPSMRTTCAAGLVGHARELLEQRGLSYPAGAGDVQRHERRFVGLQRRPEELDLRLTSDEAPPPGRREPVGDPGTSGIRVRPSA